MNGIAYGLIGCLILVGLPGCSYESRKVTRPEPGLYKGAQDPLVTQQRRQELIHRFKLVQTDRES